MKHLTTKSEKKFQKVMHEFGKGELKSHGKPVTDQRQALAIAYGEARKVYPNYGMMKKGGDTEKVAVPGLFSLDAIEGKTFKGYTFGDDWNGWATPYFESEETNEIAHALGGRKVYDKPSYFLFPEEGPGSDLTDGPYKSETIKTVDGDKYVYPIGAYNWTWTNDLLRNGGGISDDRAAELAKIYREGTAKQLWEAWTPDNRIHFLMDHAVEFFELMEDNFKKSSNSYSVLSYDALPSPIKKSLAIHHAQGMYGNGGGISRFWDTTKKHTKTAFEKSKELAGKGYEKTKAGYNQAKEYTKGKIHDKKKEIALDVLDEARNNADTKDQSRILHAAANLVEDQYAGGGGIKSENDFEPGTPAVYHSMGGYPKRHLEESGEIIIKNGKKGISLYPDENYSGSEERFIIPDWNNVETFSEANKRKEKKQKFVIKMDKGGIITSYRDIPYNEVEDYADDKALNIQTEGNFKEAAIALFNEKYAPKLANLSPKKKKLLERIQALQLTKSSASESARNSIQKKINLLEKEFNYNPSVKERAEANKGKFAMDVPVKYSKAIYKKLWSMNMNPRILKLDGKASIVVSGKINLDKAHEVYANMLKAEKQPVPSLSKISRKV